MAHQGEFILKVTKPVTTANFLPGLDGRKQIRGQIVPKAAGSGTLEITKHFQATIFLTWPSNLMVAVYKWQILFWACHFGFPRLILLQGSFLTSRSLRNI